MVEHAPGSQFPTAEIDHLAVTPFGVFIFETKHWSGRIFPSSARGMLTRVADAGQSEDRRSPLDQNRTKVAFSRARLPSNWPVAGAGLFTSPAAALDPDLNANLLSLTDVGQWLRMRSAALRYATCRYCPCSCRHFVLLRLISQRSKHTRDG
jgi:hypothetical protein